MSTTIPDVDFLTPYVIDDFLSPIEFEAIRSLTCNEEDKNPFAYFPHKFVTSPSEVEDQSILDVYWNWYATHMIYKEDQPKSNLYWTFYNIIIKKFYDMKIIKSLIRVKANLYPYTENLKQHCFHTDADYKHKGALFSINTCDGYTEFEDGTKIDSVENRIVFFDPSIPHRSTTTTNAYARFDINFNFI
tara:strand:- start:149 stop:715 length:567 start_codon:yes stop_codon:yes gene_type:complete